MQTLTGNFIESISKNIFIKGTKAEKIINRNSRERNPEDFIDAKNVYENQKFKQSSKN